MKPYMNIVDIIFIILRHFIYSIYYKQFQSSSLKVVSAEEKLSFNFTFESYGWERSYGFLALWREVEDSEERGASDSDNVTTTLSHIRQLSSKARIHFILLSYTSPTTQDGQGSTSPLGKYSGNLWGEWSIRCGLGLRGPN